MGASDKRGMGPTAAELDIGQSATLTDFAMCVNHYRLSTPGLYVCVHVPVQLDEETRIIPGLIAQVNSGPHKQCDPGSYTYFSGPPNFVFDAFGDNQKDEYEYRRQCFETSGVVEYVAWFASDKLPIWNRRQDRRFKEVNTDQDGLIQSTALPGMWLPVEALGNRDWWSVIATIARGITRREHHDFMATIWRD
ncbi:MAG: hypothetical protein GKR89_15535 [Candidatus Latescibacteria bacterium]|nr:hypothetical protein [Candidatus Latescibacterota bacterium]